MTKAVRQSNVGRNSMTRKAYDRAALIEPAVLREELTAIYQAHSRDETRVRALVLARLKEVSKAGREEAERRLMADRDGRKCAIALCELQDELIRVIYDFTVAHVYRAKNPSSAERLSVVAVGGYGRGMLAPGSDIDLLLLLPYKQTAWGESVIEYLLYMLWDMGFKVGHATRSVDGCIRLSKSDTTVQTAILEARFIWGDRALFDDLVTRYEAEIMAGGAEEFIARKLTERDERHNRVGQSRYLVEPDVKDGKGGLRDLQTLFWIAKFCYRTQRSQELVDAGVFTKAEYRRFRKCETFLWTVRCHLHFLACRSEDRLSFDRQRDLSDRLGYAARGGLKDVERFMKHYFLVAKDVGDLTRIFCAALEAQEMKPAPILSQLLKRLTRGSSKALRAAKDFRLDVGRINVSSDEAFQSDPVNLLRLFHLAGRDNVGIHPNALKLVTRSLRLIGKDLRRDAEANRLFMEMLTSKNDPETVLRKMNEAGVLGRFIPDFGKIVALMQFNMYHHYTVDEHLLRSLGILSEIERGLLGEEHPLANEIIHTLKHRRALYLAVLLHDIAKGRKEDHAIAGERVARRLGPRLGLSAAETNTVAWLVRHHLVMSNFSQTRDLNDFKTILDFAAIVQSPERLKLLLILTVADIKAVGPGVWNGWKGQLLRTLYYETEPVLSGGHVTISREQRVDEAQSRFAARMADWPIGRLEEYFAKHYAHYWLNVDLERQAGHAKLIRQSEETGREVITAVHTDDFTAITELTVLAPDHPRLLSLLTGACASAGANIAGAQIFTTADGRALDTLHIQRAFADAVDEERRAARIAETIERALTGQVRIPELVAEAKRPKGRLKAFNLEPEVMIDNDSSNLFTVIEVNGLDRTGLLYELTSKLSGLNLNIGSAHIATFGERVVDAFYVTDLTGQKVVNGNRQAKIKRELRAVLASETRDAQSAAAE